MDIKEAFQWVSPRFEGHPDVDHLAFELVNGEHKIIVHLNKDPVSPALALGLRPQFACHVILVSPSGETPSFHNDLELAVQKIMEGPE